MQHPDLTVIQADNEGGTLKVDQIRDVRKSLTYKPYQSKYRVALFLRFHEANDSAANALLKTLEEAPSYAVLILTADNPEQLLPTIVSRCEVLRLRSLKVGEVQHALEERGFETNQSKLIAHISGGRLGYARRLLESESMLGAREERLNDLQSLMSASRVEKFSYADRLSKDKDSMRQAILIWLSYWRDVMLRTAQAETPLVNVDRNLEIEDVAGRMDLSSARRVVGGLEEALEKMERKMAAGAAFIITQPVIEKNAAVDKLLDLYPEVPVIIEAWMSKKLYLLSDAVGYKIPENTEFDPLAALKALHGFYPDCGFYLSLLGFKTQYHLIGDLWP
jgi:DNA polymerase III gamma/tau subunit